MVVEFIRYTPFIRKGADLATACMRAQDQLLTSPDILNRESSPMKDARHSVRDGARHSGPTSADARSGGMTPDA